MAPSRDTIWTVGPAHARWRPPGAGGQRPASGPGQPKRRKRLSEVEAFGADPGRLRMLAYAPPSLPHGAALVVVLHGCTQNAEDYDAHAGWTALADELGFATLYPEQRRSNNPLNCFNWFQAADSARGLGEARSIREMIETMVATHGLDRGRVFVVGLSAGGAMASALLADYPDVFAAGAIIAGLPCGAASGVREAFDVMREPPTRSDAELGDAVRAGAPHAGPWPRVSIWHGLADRTVAPENGEQAVRQWLEVHGATPADLREERDGPRRRRVWSVGGRDVVEATTIDGMGHGAPLDGRMSGERRGPYMLDVGLSSTRAIARFFGLGQDRDGATRAPARERPAERRRSDATLELSAPGGGGVIAGRDAEARDAEADAFASAGAPGSQRRSEPAGSQSPELFAADRSRASGGAQGGTASASRDDPRGAADDFERDGRRGGPSGRRLDIGATIAQALRAAGLMR